MRYALPLLLMLAQPALAGEMKIITAGAPASAGDMWARALKEAIGPGAMVINKPGAAGYNAALTVLGAKPDGMTILVGSPSLVIADKVSELVAGMTPLGIFANVATCLATPDSFSSYGDLMSYAKKHGIMHAGIGPNGMSDVLGKNLGRLEGYKTTSVIYADPIRAGMDVARGEVQVFFTPCNQIGPGMRVQEGHSTPFVYSLYVPSEISRYDFEITKMTFVRASFNRQYRETMADKLKMQPLNWSMTKYQAYIKGVQNMASQVQ